MKLFAHLLIKMRHIIAAVFLIAAVLSYLASLEVSVNNNLVDYLPDDSPSTVALDVMNEEYEKGASNMRVMVKNVTIPEALEMKARLEAVDGVDETSWLDDAVNIYEPTEFLDKDAVEDYYKDNTALYVLTVAKGREVEAYNSIRDIIGDENAISGSAADTAFSVQVTAKEVSNIMAIAIGIIFVVLIITTNSWFEPVLFLSVIGVAIVLNRGTNLMFGEISFVTNSAGSILQLAVSMDYSIFLLHRFEEFRQEEPDVQKAMEKAICASTPSILSSGVTTVFGFVALILMKFKIGPDMGYVMAKAIVLSLASVLLLMPVLIMYCYKLVDKTRHKPLIPPLNHIGKYIVKLRAPIVVVFAAVTIPCYLAQQNNNFLYGSSGIFGSGTVLGDDTELIEEVFGKSNLMCLMVPNGSPSVEKALGVELSSMDKITSILSYSETVGVEIPQEFIPPDTLEQLVSPNYSRWVITVDVDYEGDEAFAMVEEVRGVVEKYFGDNYLLCGDSVNSYDMKSVVAEDNEKVNMIAILSIAIVLLINFKSLSIPVILLLVIESSVWINLSVPYFSDMDLRFIGYLIISSVQLGATVDYAILYADRYIENRRESTADEAAANSLSETILSILTSASILTIAGAFLGILSSNEVISQLGDLVGRGAILSGVLVIFVLPAIMRMCDKLVYFTTYKPGFYKGGKLEKSKGEDINEGV